MSSQKWIQLPSLIDEKSYKNLNCFRIFEKIQTSNLFFINDNEFATVPCWIFCKETLTCYDEGVYKYNIIDQKWRLLMKYPHNYCPQWNRVVYNKETKKIYSSCNNSSMTTIDLKTKEAYRHTQITNAGKCSSLLMINSKCHVVASLNTNKHSIWNDERKDCDPIYEFKEWEGGINSTLPIYIKSQNKILCFGGYVLKKREHIQDIWSHTLGTTKWDKLPLQCPKPISSTGVAIAITAGEKYIIFLGGCHSLRFTGIHVLILEEMQFKKCSFNIPVFNTACSAIMYVECNDKLVSGFLRSQGNIPLDITQLIISMTTVEWLYLLMKGGSLWKIALVDILCNCHNVN